MKIGAGEDTDTDSDGSIPSDYSASAFLDPDSDSITGMFDVVFMLKTLVRGAITGVIAIVVGSVLSVWRATGELYGDLASAAGGVWSTLLSFPEKVQEEAARVALEEIAVFDIFAGPASFLVLFAFFLGVAGVLYLFVWGGE